MKVIKVGAKCDLDGCEETATTLAYDRDAGRVGFYCDTHWKYVIDKGGPEYSHICPNCGCVSGVN